MPLANLDQLVQSGLVDETNLQKIGRVDAQQECRALGHGRVEVSRVGAVGRTYFDEADTRLTHHIWNAEAAADLDQLAARNDRLASLAERRQNQ